MKKSKSPQISTDKSLPRVFPVKYANVSEVTNENNVLSVWLNPIDYYPSLHFGDRGDTVFIMLSGQCGYDFPFKLEKNKIVVYYDTLENCIYDSGIKDDFGLRKHPVVGKPFIIFTLEHDTVLNAKYLFPQWIDSVNKVNKGLPAFVNKFRSVSDGF